MFKMDVKEIEKIHDRILNDIEYGNFDLLTYQQFVDELSLGLPSGDAYTAYLGLELGEAGEIQNLLKKAIRGDYDADDLIYQDKIKEELGDLLWYVTALAIHFGFGLHEVIGTNVEKLNKRAQEGTVRDSGKRNQ